ncbi:sugar ABC transporter permease [Clostridia bacterium]|nr:sugar ABC transporter permease [Clostridia bacterium]
MLKRAGAFDWVIGVLMAFVIVVTLYPMYYVFCASISESNRLSQHMGVLLYPLGFKVGAYRLVFDNPMILRGYMNTLLYVVLGTSLNVAVTILSAFVLSRKGLFWGKTLRMLLVVTMFFSGGMIPFYLVVDALGLNGKWWAVILPYLLNPMNVVIMRTSFEGVPPSLEESVYIDGAREFTLLTRIIVPLSMPVIAVMILFYGVGHWNSWFSAMMFIKDRQHFPLQLILREILIVNSTSDMTTAVESADKAQIAESVKYASIVISTLPILCVYPFLQKYFTKGVMIGAIKE